MGSQSKTDLAYVAGFLDGDGSLMIQVKKRKDGNKSGKRFMLTVCFYQNSRHEEPLRWIRKVVGIGYFSKRKDGMSELRINGFQQVGNLLEKLLPFIKFKKIQALNVIAASQLLQKGNLSDSDIRKLVDYVLIVQRENYITRKKKTREELLSVLGLTP